MPRKNILTKEQIVEAATDFVRENGIEKLNARTLSTSLGCSTQPIYSLFENMTELKRLVFERAKEVHKQKVELYFDKTDIPRYKAYGMGYVRFAKEERQLFKFLYMPAPQDMFGAEFDNNYDDIIKEMQRAYGLSKKQAEDFHLDMSIYTFGLAVMQYYGRNASDEEIGDRLKAQFMALMSNLNK